MAAGAPIETHAKIILKWGCPAFDTVKWDENAIVLGVFFGVILLAHGIYKRKTAPPS